MSINISVPSHIEAIPAYPTVKPIEQVAQERGIPAHAVVKLSQNENPLGVSPKVKAAIIAALEDCTRYPDAGGFNLKNAIAKAVGVPYAQVVLGNGSNDVLEMISLAYLQAQDEVVYAQHSFVVYSLATQARGARAVVVPTVDFGIDVAATIAAVNSKTKIVFIANPSNPTGTYLNKEQMATLLTGVSAKNPHALMVLDEAYNEFLHPEERTTPAALLATYANLVITRSLSKAYGLAGLRVGFGLASPAIIDTINKVRQPFNVNILAQAAAIAALGDSEYLQKAYTTNLAGLAQLTEGVTALGLGFIPSRGNFVCVRVGAAEKTQKVNALLAEQGIMVRPIGNYGMAEYLRISVGTQPENARLLEVLNSALAQC
ncbi:MAG: hypothetical protein RLZZ502_968 [Pseudomonadota bacterium]|jgi:histidinol-phosphate aminotransferase